ncbi:unnamed protein product [Brassicogethes aeneus]|uniref:Ankyrin repeat protein n=1 Tax=Brassicogethes aeneus TaxID=1431903 RepID=A0A9P0BAX2_BRAAE|nr:unnamed protein product [Brassicogethes aeneus]
MDELCCESIIDFNFFEVAHKNSFAVLLIALEHHELYNFDLNSTDEWGNTILHICATKGIFNSPSKANINGLNKITKKPIDLEHKNICTKIINILVGKGASINKPNLYGETPIFSAVRSKNINLVKFFHENGAYLTYCNKNNETLLHISEDLSITKYLVKNGLDVNKEAQCFITALQARVYQNNVEISRYLIDNGANINVLDTHKRNLLHIAIMLNFYEIAELLVEKKINLNALNEYHYTPLHYAVEILREKFVYLLLINGADVNISDLDDYTPLHAAAARAGPNLIKLLLKYKPREHKTIHGDLPVHIAARYLNLHALLLLLNKENMTALNKEYKTPLQLACDEDKDMKKWFIHHGFFKDRST